MPVRLQCQQGHVWEFAHDGRSTLPLVADVCPVCGQRSERVSLASAATGTGEFGTTTFHAGIPPADVPTVPGYEIMAELGHGGMGFVYKARQLSLNRVVGLKLPRTNPTASAVLSERFRAEAEVVASLRHPHIVQVHDFGVHDGRPFFSMEYLDGGSLADRVKDTLLPPRPAATLVATLARAVQAAHAAGIIHRDLKPANVLLTDDGTPKIADFGLAVLLAGGSKASGIEGTPGYMAPEQAEGRTDQIGPATDVYALGAILYRLLTGRPPHDGTDVLEAIERVVKQPPELPRRLRPALPRDLEAICLKCLEKDPSRRYDTAAAMADDLDRFLAGKTVVARRPPVLERAARGARRRPTMTALLAMLFAAVIAGGWYWNANWRDQVEYYSDRLYRWGVPEGIDRLTAEEVSHREASLKFYRRGGRVHRIDVVNADGLFTTRHPYGSAITTRAELTGIEHPECRFDYEFTADGRLIEEVARDAENAVIWKFIYTAPTDAHYVDQRGVPIPRDWSGSAFVKFALTDEGFPRELKYFDEDEKPTADGRGAFGERWEYNDAGLPFKRSFLGAKGQIRAVDRVASLVYQYDGRGRAIRFSQLDEKGDAVKNPQGFSAVKTKFDDWGNVIRLDYFDPAGNLCLRDDGYAACVIRRDDRGRPVYGELFGVDLSRCRCTEGYFRMRVDFDERGYPASQTFYDKEDNRCNKVDGVGRLDSTYTARGDIATIAAFDKDDIRIRTKNEGVHRVIFTHAGGDQIEVRFEDEASHPCDNVIGVRRWVNDFDTHHLQIRRRYLDDDNHARVGEEGVAGFTSRYDTRRREIERTFFDADGKPIRLKDGRIWKLVRSLVVITVDSGGRADKAGIRVGDILVSYDGRPVSDLDDFQAIRDAEPLDGPNRELTVLRESKTLTISIPPGKLGYRYRMRSVQP